MSPSLHPSPCERLRQFLETEMAMSHVYQPLMVQTILERDGAATRREIAAAFLAADLSQLEYYEHVVARYPGPILKRRGIVDSERKVYRLSESFDGLQEGDKAALIALCKSKVAKYVAQRAGRIWEHRRGNSEPVPGSVRWNVLQRSLGRCEACGISNQVRPLEVDHIIPRSKGGTNDLWNLQALCYLCNAQKRDRDSTNFRAEREAAAKRVAGCPICDSEPFAANELAIALVLDGAHILAPRRHGVNWRDLSQGEVNSLRSLEQTVIPEELAHYPMRTEMIPCPDGVAGHLSLRFSA